MKSIKSDRNAAEVYIPHPFEGSLELNFAPFPPPPQQSCTRYSKWIFHHYFPEERGWTWAGPGWFGKLSNPSAPSLNFLPSSVSFHARKLERKQGGLGMTLFLKSHAWVIGCFLSSSPDSSRGTGVTVTAGWKMEFPLYEKFWGFCPKSRQKTSVCYRVITQQLILFLGISYIMTLIQNSEVKMKDLGDFIGKMLSSFQTQS